MYHGENGKMLQRGEIERVRPDLAPTWDAVEATFPVRITRSFALRAELTDPHDPLGLQVLPDPRELEADASDLEDPVGDAAHSPVPWVIRKYPDRMLLLLTKRCHVYCRYCFRRDHRPGEREDPTDEEWERALAYVRATAPRELVLSGGDPLAVPVRRLLDTIDRVRPPVRVLRVHTRAPVTFPESVTDALVEGLRARAPVWVVVHCNHPRELAADVDRALARLVDAGIPVLNQAVLLRGVNDDPAVLAALCEALYERRVQPYYLHVTDRARGNAHLRVSIDAAIALHRALAARVGGPALPRLVVDPPDGSGKVDAERLVSRGR